MSYYNDGYDCLLDMGKAEEEKQKKNKIDD